MPERKAARKPLSRQVTYIARNFSFNTPGISTAANICVGTLPAGCWHLSTSVRVKTAFNGSTNIIVVGTSADDDRFMDAATVGSSVTEGTPGVYPSVLNLAAVYTADTPVFVQYTFTGTPTTGEADVVLQYIHIIR